MKTIPIPTGERIVLRRARPDDLVAIRALIRRSARSILPQHYTPRQMAGLWPMLGLDPRLIEDGTYFVAETGRRLVGSGGWSLWPSLVHAANGPERHAAGSDRAPMRAFYTDPDFIGRGLGSALLEASEQDAVAHGFREGELIATLAGERLYRKAGWWTVGPLDIAGANGEPLRAVRMRKTLRPLSVVA